MILLMNIIIALAGFVGIVFTRKLSKQGEMLDFKNHFIILSLDRIFQYLIKSSTQMILMLSKYSKLQNQL